MINKNGEQKAFLYKAGGNFVTFIMQWLDLIWIPLVFVFTARRHWPIALILVITIILSLRLQVELMNEIGLSTGFLPFVDMYVLYRGYIIYGFFIFVFLLLSFFSKRENTYVYIAAAIGIFIFSFCLSSATMFL